jgi:hypothetical protein
MKSQKARNGNMKGISSELVITGNEWRNNSESSDFKPKFVYLKAEVKGESIAIHNSLFWMHVKDETFLKGVGRGDGVSDTHIIRCDQPYDLCALKGLAHWMYRQELPPQKTIENIEYPQDWIPKETNGTDEHLALKMAFELYHLAWLLDIYKLQNDVMTYLFGIYMDSRELVPMVHVDWVFETFNKQDLISAFCIDIYFKRNLEPESVFTDALWEDMGCDGIDYPRKFLFGIFSRQSWLNYHYPRPKSTDAAISSVSNTPSTTWVMRLCDYHLHEDNKQCTSSIPGKVYIIE